MNFKNKFNQTTHMFEDLSISELGELWSLCILSKAGIVDLKHPSYIEYVTASNQEATAINTGILFYSTSFIQTCLFSIVNNMMDNKYKRD